MKFLKSLFRVLTESAGTEPVRREARGKTTTRDRQPARRPTPQPKQAGPQWVARHENSRIADRNIGGMVYIGKSPRSRNYDSIGGISIDPSLKVAAKGNDINGDTMPYWPDYDTIAPRARATYLDWLASGRSDLNYSVGYVFLYFYGLEYRFFQDNPSEDDKIQILDEVARLLGIYWANSSVRTYLSTFLNVGRITMDPTELPREFEYQPYEIPLSLRIAIGLLVKDGVPLDAEWLLAWYCAHPGYSLRTPAQRAPTEFRDLFKILFNEKCPDGIKVNPPKKSLQATYAAASGRFSTNIGSLVGLLPDISTVSTPLVMVDEIVEEATKELDRYSRFLGRNPDGGDSIEAHSLLPKRLWDRFPSSELEKLRQWATTTIGSGGLTEPETLIEQVQGARPAKTSKALLTSAANALARVSVGLAPDPKYSLRAPKPGEPVILFALPDADTELDSPSTGYSGLLMAITIGTFIASADGTVAPLERARLESMIQHSTLGPGEHARLSANLEWMMTVRPQLATVKRHLNSVNKDASEELGKVALAMTAADGLIDSTELKALEKLYTAIGLEKEGIYSALHALTASPDPVTVRTADSPKEEFSIPAPPEHTGKVAIDTKRVEAIMADTARVSSILTSIFGDEEETANAADATGAPNMYGGLDQKQTAFLTELITRQQWAEDECQELAVRFQVMLSGTLEALNEWSFDRWGDTLIDVDDGYHINQAIAPELKQVK